VIQEINEEDWGFAGLLTDDWKKLNSLFESRSSEKLTWLIRRATIGVSLLTPEN
jgi:hypothetical protein